MQKFETTEILTPDALRIYNLQNQAPYAHSHDAKIAFTRGALALHTFGPKKDESTDDTKPVKSFANIENRTKNAEVNDDTKPMRNDVVTGEKPAVDVTRLLQRAPTTTIFDRASRGERS